MTDRADKVRQGYWTGRHVLVVEEVFKWQIRWPEAEGASGTTVSEQMPMEVAWARRPVPTFPRLSD
jgi:hypothetical protein